jgi:hypothetical protein
VKAVDIYKNRGDGHVGTRLCYRGQNGQSLCIHLFLLRREWTRLPPLVRGTCCDRLDLWNTCNFRGGGFCIAVRQNGMTCKPGRSRPRANATKNTNSDELFATPLDFRDVEVTAVYWSTCEEASLTLRVARHAVMTPLHNGRKQRQLQAGVSVCAGSASEDSINLQMATVPAEEVMQASYRSRQSRPVNRGSAQLFRTGEVLMLPNLTEVSLDFLPSLQPNAWTADYVCPPPSAFVFYISDMQLFFLAYPQM